MEKTLERFFKCILKKPDFFNLIFFSEFVNVIGFFNFKNEQVFITYEYNLL